jgi:alpha-amylase/alpha-mannosidase (GH57 family)
MEKSICIHGHFYQPPRENAWLEAVELQDSAYPYHNWNERVTAQCYATMATSRLLDEQGLIRKITNNYAKISFNFGPTLLAWLQAQAPVVYGAILEADRRSRRRFSGHGAAMAQVYSHIIMPLANRRDKETQVVWAIADFRHRFGRLPEGMWLPETAVDLETLEVLADHQIAFTILSPHQARRIRHLEGGDWLDVAKGKIDPSRPYLARLPSGNSIVLFFYDAPISRAVAFEGLLSNGERFAHRLMDGFDDSRKEPQLVHIATDGESYGHHHHKGNMALAFALHAIERRQLCRLTVFGEYLDMHPPQWEVEIFEKTSWSCPHGVERWWRDCGCNSGQHPGWRQGWRTPLREAFDWLRDTLAPAYEEKMAALGLNPWATRNDYIQVILNREPEAVDDFLAQRANRTLSCEEKILAIQLLELQRHAMLMYTSCGWFFDDISGLETVQMIQYAGRALQLSKEVFGGRLENRFMQLLEKAPSNIRDHQNGRRIYEKFVQPAMVDLGMVGAHYAMRSLFEEYPQKARVNCYTVKQSFFKSLVVGRAKLALGCVRIFSTITRESAGLCFGAIHWGDHNISCCISPIPEGTLPEETFVTRVFEVFGRADFPTALLLLEKTIGTSTYSLRHLFRDEQRRILQIVLESNLTHAEAAYRQIYEANAPLLLFLKDLMVPVPPALSAAAEYLLNASIRRAFESTVFDLNSVRQLLDAALMHGVPLDPDFLEMAIRRRLEQTAADFLKQPTENDALLQLDAISALLCELPFEVNLRTVQNIYYHILNHYFPQMKKKMGRREKGAKEWVESFQALGAKIGMRTEFRP